MQQHTPPMQAQRGMALIVVLVALLLISFASISLLRSTDTSTLIAGNIGFKQAALGSGDAAVEAALTWLNDHNSAGGLFFDNVDAGYFATDRNQCDLTGSNTPNDRRDDVGWLHEDMENNCNLRALVVAPTGVEPGYTVSYVINRLCNAEGDNTSVLAADGVTPMVCSHVSSDAISASTHGGADYANRPLSSAAQLYFRITTRILGPRNTVRYIQVMVVL
jgi:type IV pilus assembly protein PilX